MCGGGILSGLIFEWDKEKARKNQRKHRLSFEEASTIFGDPLSLTLRDPIHSGSGEERFVIVGESSAGRTLVVAFTERGTAVRIISARPATKREKNQYEEDK